jgi:low temperature requirement protein LtrA
VDARRAILRVAPTFVLGPAALFAVIAAVALAFVLTVFLWWAYFDIVALAAEDRLTRARNVERTVLARDAYTYLHYPLIAGIVGFAYGCKKVVSLTTTPLSTVGAVALCGGVAVYLLGATRAPGTGAGCCAGTLPRSAEAPAPGSPSAE